MENTYVKTMQPWKGILEAFERVEQRFGYTFDVAERMRLIQETYVKWMKGSQDLEYLYALLEDELRDYLMRAYINAQGYLNERREINV